MKGVGRLGKECEGFACEKRNGDASVRLLSCSPVPSFLTCFPFFSLFLLFIFGRRKKHSNLRKRKRLSRRRKALAGADAVTSRSFLELAGFYCA